MYDASLFNFQILVPYPSAQNAHTYCTCNIIPVLNIESFLIMILKINITERQSSLLGCCYYWRGSIYILDEHGQWKILYERGTIKMECS